MLHKSRVKPKAINRSNITLDLNRFQTLPPKAPTAKPTTLHRPIKPLVASPPKSLLMPKNIPIKKRVKKTQNPKKREEFFAQKREQNLSKKRTPQENEKRKKAQKNTKIERVKKLQKSTQKKRKAVRKKPPRHQKVAMKTPLKHHRLHKAVPKRRPHPRGPNSRLIRSLYGNSYSRMSRTQRKFIDENLRRILEISQRTLNYLGYPREAARFGEQGTNIVQFWLYPNGDIRGLHLRRRIGSSSLDCQTIEVIKTASMNYPHPKVKTKIIIYVRYRLD